MRVHLCVLNFTRCEWACGAERNSANVSWCCSAEPRSVHDCGRFWFLIKARVFVKKAELKSWAGNNSQITQHRILTCLLTFPDLIKRCGAGSWVRRFGVVVLRGNCEVSHRPPPSQISSLPWLVHRAEILLGGPGDGTGICRALWVCYGSMGTAQIQVCCHQLPLENQLEYKDVKRAMIHGVSRSPEQDCEQFQILTFNKYRLFIFGEQVQDFGHRWLLKEGHKILHCRPHVWGAVCCEYHRPATLYEAIYLAEDHLAVYSPSSLSHCPSWLKHLRAVLRSLRQAGLAANPRKCSIGQAEVQYLGFHLGNTRCVPKLIRLQQLWPA